MIERVLVPADWSDQAHGACEFVFEEFPEATVVLLHVIDPSEAGYSTGTPFPSASEDWYEQQRTDANTLFDELAAEADDHGIETERAIEVGKPTQTIVEYAEDHDIDHVVMGSHGRKGVTRILLGNVAEKIVRRSPVPVTVVR